MGSIATTLLTSGSIRTTSATIWVSTTSFTAFLRTMPATTRRHNNPHLAITTKANNSRRKRVCQDRMDVIGVPIVSPEKSNSLEEPETKRAKKRMDLGRNKKASSSPPDDWFEIYELVEELRKDGTAPCDSMGCEALAIREENDLPGFRFHVLVALLLSSQTKDAVVAEAFHSMKDDGILSIESLRQPEITEQLLATKYLGKVGFRNNKAKFLKQIVSILHEDYANDIPPTAAKIMELPGIGPKMAYICESVAWDPTVPSGIGVDTHMHRLLNQLGWVKSKTPEQTRVQMESWLPVEKWRTVNLLWVGFGQEVQQQKDKMLKKAIVCSQPARALQLLQRCGMNLKKDGAKYNLEEQITAVLKNDRDGIGNGSGK